MDQETTSEPSLSQEPVNLIATITSNQSLQDQASQAKTDY
ncbi:19851_t:CDS:2 [Gigaspora margarita]|uniref:19851_t:CDS:1 n=1 Tax=Gigaspora margarita TaxID=4874 RepID=A0ABN7V0N7_GIGMA|nr:19851_t:CDS:2 [Gigaspora margarita]